MEEEMEETQEAEKLGGGDGKEIKEQMQVEEVKKETEEKS